MTTNSNPMLDRVRALLAKAQSTEFQAEADAFMQKAFEIMAREGITEQDLQETDTFKVESRRIGLKSTTWREDIILASVVSGALGCVVRMHAYDSVFGAYVVFYGTKKQLERAELMFTSLLFQRTRASRRRPKYESIREFASGYAAGVQKVFRDAVREVEKTDGTNVLPVLKSMAEKIEEELSPAARNSRMQPARPGRNGYSAGLTADTGVRERLAESSRKAIGR